MPPEIHIRDPLYGFIPLNDIEHKIIQTYPFQRLRFINQLGPTYWVYPSATHTRFDHSLGVAYLSTKVVNHLKHLKLLPEITGEDEQIFKLACLLHDVGHAPFSHSGEEMDLFPRKITHETMGIKIIEETGIGDIIRKNFKEEGLKRILFILTPEKLPIKRIDMHFNNLLTGQAGIDRMDYLLRDSYFLGVMYGKFDLERLIETMLFREDKGCFWEEGGKHALEQFLLARYFMFTEVYFHKTRRSLDYHLGKLIKSFLKENFKR